VNTVALDPSTAGELPEPKAVPLDERVIARSRGGLREDHETRLARW
jgi:hypothetical protein